MSSSQPPGILLVNLGSPDAPTVPAVRRYLDEFLMDKRVIDKPFLLRALVVKGIILNTRPRGSAEAYSRVWTDEGSPLIVNSRRLEQQVAKLWRAPVALGMRYGKPSIEAGLQQLQQQGVDQVIVVPLYPHYAMSSYETVVEKARDVVSRQQDPPQLHFLEPFYSHPAYRKALADVTRGHLEGDWDHLLFSFHGLPVRHIEKCDPDGDHCLQREDCCFTDAPSTRFCYRAQVMRSASNLAQDLGLSDERWSVSFQSSLGKDPWLEPFTEATTEKLAASGVRHLKVICPAFVADCLETVDEVERDVRAAFIGAGGEQFDVIPCLNDDPRWVAALVEMARESASVM